MPPIFCYLKEPPRAAGKGVWVEEQVYTKAHILRIYVPGALLVCGMISFQHYPRRKALTLLTVRGGGAQRQSVAQGHTDKEKFKVLQNPQGGKADRWM